MLQLAELRWKQLSFWLCLHDDEDGVSVKGDVVYLDVRTERASRQNSLYGERGESGHEP